MTEDEKQIEKAKQDVAEKGADSQTEKDRIDESVGEQEERSGDEDSQDAKDRVDESEGAEKADEERAEERESKEAKLDAALQRMSSVFDRMEKFLDGVEKQAEAAADADSEAAKRMDETYGIGNGVFQGEDKSVPERQLTKEEIAKKIHKIM